MAARISKEMTTLVVESDVAPDRIRFLQIREDMPTALETGKYPIRVDISWQYDGDNTGMPTDETTDQIATLEEALIPALEKNNLALLAYQVTGDGERLWCFYTRNIRAFQTTLNESLEELSPFPLTFYAEEDREGEAFAEVLALLH